MPRISPRCVIVKCSSQVAFHAGYQAVSWRSHHEFSVWWKCVASSSKPYAGVRSHPPPNHQSSSVTSKYRKLAWNEGA